MNKYVCTECDKEITESEAKFHPYRDDKKYPYCERCFVFWFK